jgi:hypothetical protein
MMPGVASFGLDFSAERSELATTCLLDDQLTMAQPAPQNTQPSLPKIEASAHSSDSSLREQALGHVFLGQLLTFMWQSGARDIEVLKSEVDRGGYDVVLESNRVIRHVQLKSSFRGSKGREVEHQTAAQARRMHPMARIRSRDPGDRAVLLVRRRSREWTAGPRCSDIPPLKGQQQGRKKPAFGSPRRS